MMSFLRALFGSRRAEAAPTLDLILVGGPGSGKGTQAEKLCAALGLTHISTGDLFRDHVARATELGARAKPYMDRGELVPDTITEATVKERLARGTSDKGFVFDGFPRTLAQAETLTKMLAGMGRRPPDVINIEVSDAAIVERLSGRLVCRDCRSSFHRTFKPPKTEDRCEQCGSELTQRSDDTPETVRSRIQVFHTESAPLIRHYEAAGLLHTVNGEAAPDAVHAAVMGKIAAHRGS